MAYRPTSPLATPAGTHASRLALVLGFTTFYLVAEVVGGLLAQSLALLADAGHMFTDVGGLALALLAMRFAARPATPARTWALLQQAVGVLLEGTPADVNLTAVREGIQQVPGVVGAHDLHVWSLTSGVNALSVHVVLEHGAAHDDVLARVHERVTCDFTIAHATVQVESQGYGAHETHI